MQEETTTIHRRQVTGPRAMIAVPKDLHDAIKAYAIMRDITIAEATEYFVKIGLRVTYKQYQDKVE